MNAPSFQGRILEQISTINITSQKLFEKYPSIWSDEYKREMFEISCPKGSVHSGELDITRWRALEIPDHLSLEPHNIEVVVHRGPFQYQPTDGNNTVEWYLNFADGDLFFHYGSKLMAQDEHQVAEHPILASVKEMLEELATENSDYDPCTRDYTNLSPNPPTPILVMGAERRLNIDLTSNTDQGRLNGLYGNRFREAPWDIVKTAVSVLSPPTISNIIAMEAPSGGKGIYTLEQIKDSFQTAYTAFSAAKEEGFRRGGKNVKTIINTGSWGTGAYGGNKVLMTSIQILAAIVSQIEQVNFYTTDSKLAKQAQSLIADMLLVNPTMAIQTVLCEIFNMEFQWGVSDGN